MTANNPNAWRQYDVYQRYSLLRRVLEGVFPEGGVQVLDIGSGPDGLCRAFLPDRFEIRLADTVTHEAEDVVPLIPGDPLPFEDGAVDVVLALDVLEHVPQSGRQALMRELARVAGQCVVVSYPSAGASVVAAEDLVAEAHRSWFGSDNAFLAEHLAYGLPAADFAKRALLQVGWAVDCLANGPLSDWLPFTVLDVMLLSQFGMGGPKDAFNGAVNRITEGVSSAGEHYRTFTVATRDAATLERMHAALAPGTSLRTAEVDQAIAVEVARALVQLAASPAQRGAEEALAAKDGHIGKLEALLQQRVRESTEQIAKQSKHIQQLERQLEEQSAMSAHVVAAKDEHIRKLEALLRGERPASA